MSDGVSRSPRAARRSPSSDGKLHVPDHPILPFIEGDGTGPDIWRASRARVRRRGREGLRRQAQDRLDGGARRREGVRPRRQLAARRDGRRVPRVPRRHQGPADHAGRRRHPLAQRGAAPDARPLRLPAPGALVPGRALAGEAAREGGHGDLPREHRGHLRRHRVRRRARPRSKKVLAFLKDEFPKEYGKIRFPETTGIGIKPVSQRGHRAAGPRRHPVRPRQRQARASRSCTRATS